LPNQKVQHRPVVPEIEWFTCLKRRDVSIHPLDPFRPITETGLCMIEGRAAQVEDEKLFVASVQQAIDESRSAAPDVEDAGIPAQSAFVDQSK
jgi:hypothetical protein